MSHDQLFYNYRQFATGFQQKTDAWCSGGGECTGLNSVSSETDYNRSFVLLLTIFPLHPHKATRSAVKDSCLCPPNSSWNPHQHLLTKVNYQIRMFCGLVGEPSYIAAAEPYYEVDTTLTVVLLIGIVPKYSLSEPQIFCVEKNIFLCQLIVLLFTRDLSGTGTRRDCATRPISWRTASWNTRSTRWM